MDLDELRKKIDELDEQIVSLLNERTDAAAKIGKVKQKTASDVYVPSREKAVLERVCELNKRGPLTDKNIRAIYREIMSAAIALETRASIAFRVRNRRTHTKPPLLDLAAVLITLLARPFRTCFCGRETGSQLWRGANRKFD